MMFSIYLPSNPNHPFASSFDLLVLISSEDRLGLVRSLFRIIVITGVKSNTKEKPFHLITTYSSIGFIVPISHYYTFIEIPGRALSPIHPVRNISPLVPLNIMHPKTTDRSACFCVLQWTHRRMLCSAPPLGYKTL